MQLDELLHGIDTRDKLYHFEQLAREVTNKPLTQTYTSAAHFELKLPYTSDDRTYKSSYGMQDTFYVHIPSWVRVERAPFHEFGSNLFGLAYTSTGVVRIREDLQDTQYKEVLQHEVNHVLYPNCSEQQIRQMTLSRFGSAAEIHTHVCRP